MLGPVQPGRNAVKAPALELRASTLNSWELRLVRSMVCAWKVAADIIVRGVCLPLSTFVLGVSHH